MEESSGIGDSNSFTLSGGKNVIAYYYHYNWDDPSSCSQMPNKLGMSSISIDFTSVNGGTPGATEVKFNFSVDKQKTGTSSVITKYEDCSTREGCPTILRWGPKPTPLPAPQYNPNASAFNTSFTVNNPKYQEIDSTLLSCSASIGTLRFTAPNYYTYSATYGDLNGNLQNASVTIKCNSPISAIRGGGGAFVSSLSMKMAGELKASELIPVQVVGNPKADNSIYDADFILGKSANFKVVLKGANLIQSTGTVQVAVMNQQNEILVVSGQINLQDINANIIANGQHTVFAGRMSKPNNPGVSWVPTAEEIVSAKVKIILGTDTTTYGALKFTSDQVKKIAVHKVTPPKIVVIKLADNDDSCPVTACIFPNDQNFNTLLQTSDYISRIYPFPDNSFSFTANSEDSVPGRPMIIPPRTDIDKLPQYGLTAIQMDMESLATRKALMSNAQRIVGVVPNSYFINHYSPAVGMAEILGSAAIVPESQAIAMAHEIGHTFGTGEEYTSKPDAAGNLHVSYTGIGVKGFDALLKNGKRTSYTWPFPDPNDIASVTGMSFMGPVAARKTTADINDLTTYWIDNKSYNTILTTMLKPLAVDPPVLVVSGMLNSSGTFDFESSYTSQEGTLTESNSSGDVAISTLDANNKIIDSVWVKSDFSLMGSAVDGEAYSNPVIQTPSAPIVVSLPLDPNIESIQIFKDNKIIQKSSVKDQLLTGIVRRIPDRAFKVWMQCEHHHGYHTNDEYRVQKLINQYRSDLNKKVQKTQKALNAKQTRTAVLLLKELVLEIEMITTKDYETVDSFELTQSQVIDQFNSIIDSLEEGIKGHFKKCWPDHR